MNLHANEKRNFRRGTSGARRADGGGGLRRTLWHYNAEGWGGNGIIGLSYPSIPPSRFSGGDRSRVIATEGKYRRRSAAWLANERR